MGVSRSEEEIRRGAKSRYYPIELSNVLQEVRQTPGRYAIVGLPCFIKAVRRLALQEPIFRERIVFCIGLVCGHLKSARFADMLAWQMGISPGELATIDFRSKMANAPASEYGIAAWTQCDAGGAARVSRSSDLYGYNWGYGFFKCNACDYCDDVMAETADLCIGDAWLPQYVADSNGTNVIVVRNGVIGEIIDEAAAAGRLKLDRITVDAIVQSQDAGLRHRREGLAYRLYLKDQAGVWRPTKRVTASGQHLTERQKKIQECRLQLAAESHCAFQAAIQANRFEIFRQQMDPLVRQYARWYRRPLWRRAVSLGRRMLRRLAKRAFPS
jgi:coenzyme F420-reducing hydrogenase beta subunit